MKTNEFVLPKIWHIKITEENEYLVNQWFDSKYVNLSPYIHLCGMVYDHKTKNITKEFNDIDIVCENGYTFGSEITFDQFKEHVLKEITKPEYDPKDVAFKIMPVSALTIVDGNVSINPKFLGYKIINDEFRIAIIKILEMDSLEYFKQDQKIDFYPNSEIEKALISLGVLSTWCKLIYDNSITLKSGVKLSEDDIAEVKEILKNK